MIQANDVHVDEQGAQAIHPPYSDTWQLVINTGTTIVTFLMVFLMQNTQNRDSKAIQLKLDELLRGVKGARTGLVRLEDLTEAELIKLEKEFEALRRPRESCPTDASESPPPLLNSLGHD